MSSIGASKCLDANQSVATVKFSKKNGTLAVFPRDNRDVATAIKSLGRCPTGTGFYISRQNNHETVVVPTRTIANFHYDFLVEYIHQFRGDVSSALMMDERHFIDGRFVKCRDRESLSKWPSKDSPWNYALARSEVMQALPRAIAWKKKHGGPLLPLHICFASMGQLILVCRAGFQAAKTSFVLDSGRMIDLSQRV